MSFEVYGASSGDNSTSYPHGFSTRRAPGERENGLGSYVGGSAICYGPLFSSVALGQRGIKNAKLRMKNETRNSPDPILHFAFLILNCVTSSGGRTVRNMYHSA